MTKIGCPLCSKTGITMTIIALALVIAGAIVTIPWLAIIGLIVLLAAYIVPNMSSGDSCHSPNSSSSANSSGEDQHD